MKLFHLPIKKFFGMLALVSYIGFGILGFIHIVHMAHMGMPMENCPLADGMHTLCAMTPVEHLRSLQETMSTYLSLHKTILPLFSFAIILLVFLVSVLPLLRLLLYAKRKDIPIPIYQELFSRGILNPRVP